MTGNKKQFAVVTGASQGLGKAFAFELARKKINLILVSLPGENLSVLAECISNEFNVETHFYETDMSENGNVLELSQWINDNFSVFILINNAGIGGSKRFAEASFQYINRILQLNVVATSIMTHQLLPNLKGQPQSYILNVSSMAAFLPCGYRTVYPASKSYVYIFSRSLGQELKGTNVLVSVVSPGVMKTNREVSKRIEKQGLLARLSKRDPEKVAEFSVRRLFRKDQVIRINRFSLVILQFIPFWLKLKVMTRISMRELDSDL